MESLRQNMLDRKNLTFAFKSMDSDVITIKLNQETGGREIANNAGSATEIVRKCRQMLAGGKNHKQKTETKLVGSRRIQVVDKRAHKAKRRGCNTHNGKKTDIER